MRGKATFLVGAATGYVLGARAGRARYEQIMTQANKLWRSPTVQATVTDLESMATDTAKSSGSHLQDKVTAAARGAVSTAQHKVADAKHSRENRTEPPGPVLSAYESTTITGMGPAGSNGQPS